MSEEEEELQAEEPHEAPVAGLEADQMKNGESALGQSTATYQQVQEASANDQIPEQTHSPKLTTNVASPTASRQETAPKPAKRGQQRFKQQQHQTVSATANLHQAEPSKQVPVSADYLAQLIKDKQQLSNFPLAFMHVQRLIDDEINKVRQSLFQLTDVVRSTCEPLELPPAEGDLVQLQEKIYVPVGEHPEYNFVGRLLGPRGMTAKQLEQETGCKIMIRGRGSMRDKKKEEQNRGKANWEHLYEELHVLISVEDTQNRAHIKLKRALEEVKQLLIPIVDGEDELKKRQLMELAIINGTYRDCNYNEALTKILNEAVFRQQTLGGGGAPQEQPAQATGVTGQTPPCPMASQRNLHYNHYSQLMGQAMMNGSSSTQQQPEALGSAQNAARQSAEPQKQMNQLAHLQQHQQNMAALAAAHRHATANSHLLGTSAAAAAAAVAAATAATAVHQGQTHPNQLPAPVAHPPPNSGGPAMQQQAPPSHPAPGNLHHQSPAVAAAAAAASAALMASQAADPSALIYAQQYHDFHHYAAMAAAASQPILTAPDFASHHHPHPQHYQQQVDHPEHHHHQQQHQAAAAAAAAALAFHHHQHQQQQQHHHLHHQHQQQQQQQQQHQQLAVQESSAKRTEGDNGNDSGSQVEQVDLHNSLYNQVQPPLTFATEEAR